MVLGKKWLFWIGNEAEIGPLEMGRKSPRVALQVRLSLAGCLCDSNPTSLTG